MATASVCSSPSARTDGVTCLALRRNEAYSGKQVVTFQIGFRRHFRPPESSLDRRASVGGGPRQYDCDGFATVEAQRRFCSDLAAAAGSSLGSAKAPAPA